MLFLAFLCMHMFSMNLMHCFINETPGQDKPLMFWFQVRTNFSGAKPIYLRSKCFEQFKIRCGNWNGTAVLEILET